MTDDYLLALDKIGFIPGPDEDEASFLLGVNETKARFDSGDWIPESHWHWVREHLGAMFNVKPLYICAFYSNRNLTPWQGAASWIEGRALHSIQLKNKLRKGTYLGIYSREEILAHEAVHAVRSGFNEDRYEEFFAYMASSSRWRRVLGPIVERPWEIYPFLIFSFCGTLFPYLYWASLLWVSMGFLRLLKRHRTLKKALSRVKSLKVLLRLTDREIEIFAKGQDIQAYASAESSLRWRVLRHYLQEIYD